jgi:hypothetical protein
MASKQSMMRKLQLAAGLLSRQLLLLRYNAATATVPWSALRLTKIRCSGESACSQLAGPSTLATFLADSAHQSATAEMPEWPVTVTLSAMTRHHIAAALIQPAEEHGELQGPILM